jgi:hypothetical protein
MKITHAMKIIRRAIRAFRIATTAPKRAARFAIAVIAKRQTFRFWTGLMTAPKNCSDGWMRDNGFK